MSSPTEVQSPGPVKKRPRLSHRAKIALALIIIGIAVVAAFFGPSENSSTNVTGDSLPATITVTNLVSTMAVNRGVDYNNARITVTNVLQASKFSDDRKPGGAYSIRVQLTARVNSGQQTPIGIDFSTITRLQLADGQRIAPKLVSISPNILPGRTIIGFMDFPVAAPIALAGLTLRLGSSSSVSFA